MIRPILSDQMLSGPRATHTLLAVAFSLGVCPAPAISQAPAPAMNATRATSPEWFEEKIRPLLAARCFECHTDEKSGGLRLDSREALLLGGESGSAIEPGKPETSLLIQVVQRVPKVPAMPKKAAKLKPEEIDDLIAWVRAGAPWPQYCQSCPTVRSRAGSTISVLLVPVPSQ